MLLPLAKPNYFASMRICIFDTKYANGMVVQGGGGGGGRSPKAITGCWLRNVALLIFSLKELNLNCT